ncbi:MAG: zinc ribbon domain-containing protein [Lachnospiraceae bacterium]|nr:zinc ribbon domain-containing protein [Lachnospiraceae bacterium]MCI9150627.1 zinc ribbon domain-containing protein [Lachnospiraceae bacterium]
MEFWTGVAAAAGIVIVAGITICFFLVRMKGLSRRVFGTDSLAEALKWQDEMLAATPRSITGMTRIYEPQIREDFPEFNWQEFRRRAEQLLLLAFEAISTGTAGSIRGGSEAFRRQVESRIAGNARAGITETYRQVKIHDTQIARYEKKAGTCVITLQSAVGHIHYKEQEGRILAGRREVPVQTKYNIELMYVQDPALAGRDRALGVSCPSCGAPITSLGVKSCEYCGSRVVPINVQVWSIHGYYEVEKQKV